jgi:hypothetical protein
MILPARRSRLTTRRFATRAMSRPDVQAFCNQSLGEGVVVLKPGKGEGPGRRKATQRQSNDDGGRLERPATIRTTATRTTRSLPARRRCVSMASPYVKRMPGCRFISQRIRPSQSGSGPSPPGRCVPLCLAESLQIEVLPPRPEIRIEEVTDRKWLTSLRPLVATQREIYELCA